MTTSQSHLLPPLRRLRLSVLLFLLLPSLSIAIPPTTAPSNLPRGRALQSLLLTLLEQSYQNQGIWPAHLPAPDNTLIYTPPPKPPANLDEHSARHLAAATVVLHESLSAHPTGVWVAYADGHLEFAPDSATLTACINQIHIILNAATPFPDIPETQASGHLTLHISDPAGHPIPNARVGSFSTTGDLFPEAFGPTLADEPANPPLLSDADGYITVPASRTFDAKFNIQQIAPLYILDPSHHLAALLNVNRTDFSSNSPIREIHLSPVCKVTGQATSIDGPTEGHMCAIVFHPGNERMYTLQSLTSGRSFEFLLPPGDYGIDLYANGTGHAYRFIHIDPTQTSLHLKPDLPPSTITRLTNHPAPEFTQIKAWKNSPPLTLASLHGHPVLLDFWGYWCNPCCQAMPTLMKLYDDYKSKGLIVIAIHDDSVASIAEMDQKLIPIRAKLWSNRDLPFPVALDGGGETRIQFSAAYRRGATTAAYGITGFPTTLLISPTGILLGTFDPENPKDLAKLQSLLPK